MRIEYQAFPNSPPVAMASRNARTVSRKVGISSGLSSRVAYSCHTSASRISNAAFRTKPLFQAFSQAPSGCSTTLKRLASGGSR